jgi:hypothetical protein
MKVNGEDRKGWYFQQLLKLGASEHVQTDNYVVVDADTVFLKKIVLINGGKYIFRRSAQYHLPYFQTYSRLFGYFPERQLSFISNYMVWNTRIVKEMLQKIETATKMKWYKAIISVIDRREGSSFSEYETYGCYIRKFYPNFFDFVFNRNLELSVSHSVYHPIISIIARLRGFESITYHNWRRN